jgi:hypothetical protein
MEERKLADGNQGVTNVSFAEGLRRIAGSELIGKVTDQERAQFERARFAEEESKTRSFVLGKQID